jgi:hypothetical protein
MTEAKLVPLWWLLAAVGCWLLAAATAAPTAARPLLLLPPTAMATRPLALPCGSRLPNLIICRIAKVKPSSRLSFAPSGCRRWQAEANAFLIAVHVAVVEIAGFIIFAPTTRAVF